MATINSILVNKGKGKVGDLIVQRWRSKKVVRAYTQHPKPSTHPEIQLRQRAKFKKVRDFVTANLAILKDCYQNEPRKKSIFNDLLSFFMDITDGSGVIDLNKCINKNFGNGKLDGTIIYNFDILDNYMIRLHFYKSKEPDSFDPYDPNYPGIYWYFNLLSVDKNLTLLHNFNVITGTPTNNQIITFASSLIPFYPDNTEIMTFIYMTKIFAYDDGFIDSKQRSKARIMVLPSFIVPVLAI